MFANLADTIDVCSLKTAKMTYLNIYQLGLGLHREGPMFMKITNLIKSFLKEGRSESLIKQIIDIFSRIPQIIVKVSYLIC